MLEKDMLFAILVPSWTKQFRLYRQLYDGLNPRPARPGLVIYLQATRHPMER